jgi:dihydroorotase
VVIRITGATAVMPGGLVAADVWVEGNSVVAVGAASGLRTEEVIEASGMFVGPGFVDLHTHLREPGETWKEDVASGTRAAVAGGYTAVVAMPNTNPAVDTEAMVERVRAISSKHAVCEVVTASALTLGRKGVEPVDIRGLYEIGVRLFTDDGDCVGDQSVLRELMTVASRLPGAVIAQHAEDPDVGRGGHMHAGRLSADKGIAGIPAEAEWEVVERDLVLAMETGARYHAQHLSSAKSIDLVRSAKGEGARVSAEVTPHHLTFDVTALSTLDTNLKMYPPLRTADDRRALLEGLADGTIDVVATDHAPHSGDDKAVDFEEAPRGVIGLETAAAAVWGVVGDPLRVFQAMSITPAAIAGLSRQGCAIEPGSPANLVVFDPYRQWSPVGFVSRSSNSPYLGATLTGQVVATIVEGRLVHKRVAA